MREFRSRRRAISTDNGARNPRTLGLPRRMPDPIEELVQRWKQNPSPATTIALCEALRGSPSAPLVQQVGEFATQRVSSNASVLVSVARMAPAHPPRFPREVATAPPAVEGPGPAAVRAPIPTSPPIPKRAGPPFGPAPLRKGIAARAVPGPGDAPVPHPRDVLDALALSGVFESQAAGSSNAAAWDRTAKGPKRKRTPTLVVGLAMFLAGSVGTYVFYRHKRADEHIRAETLLASVEAQLEAGRPDAVAGVERDLAQALQLETRSPRAALDWAKERAVVG